MPGAPGGPAPAAAAAVPAAASLPAATVSAREARSSSATHAEPTGDGLGGTGLLLFGETFGELGAADDSLAGTQCGGVDCGRVSCGRAVEPEGGELGDGNAVDDVQR